jgi:hypothetical protein|tara:strand:- start:168 stop:851 length:684 start_codon:yes stop_codon:yes gene_type:complete
MQKTLLLFIMLISTILVSCSDNEERVISEQDVDYIINGTDFPKGGLEFKPGSPQTEKQTLLMNAMNDFNQLVADSNKVISQIGAFEFSSVTELADKDSVIAFKGNLKKYADERKLLYGKSAQLVKKHSGLIGGSGTPGTTSQLLEKKENVYVEDLDKFYNFILQNYDKIQFTDENVLLETDEMVKEYSNLFNKMIASATELTNFRDGKAETMKNFINESKVELNGKE